jgi:hypothetical protein
VTADEARKKQLGQYFTGVPVARLLAALVPKDTRTGRVLDPMAGQGDMLQACLELGPSPTSLDGWELDPVAAGRAGTRLVGAATITCTDAFKAKRPGHPYDLVITNPPYVRYQGRSSVSGISVPAASSIRYGLIASIQSATHLSDAARSLFLSLASSYPATADVAVPAWILSASLVSEDGALAVVVPQAWMSRNYAAGVRQMLDTAFDVAVVVEDGDASWFDDALVRTHLVVARRRKVDGGTTGRSRVVVARATSQLMTDGRLRGRLRSELSVAAALAKTNSPHAVEITPGLTARLEVRESAHGESELPQRLLSVLPRRPQKAPLRTLESWGWTCGQGMRTGANEFFYLRCSPMGGLPADRWGWAALPIPKECLLPVVRRQSDLHQDLAVSSDTLGWRLLSLRGWTTRVDRARALHVGLDAEWFDRQFKLLPDAVAAWIDHVAASSAAGSSTLFPELTAVAPNVRRDRSGRPSGYWYQLPELAPRHVPELFLARVVGARPSAYSNVDRAVVDANFATMWAVDEPAMPAAAMSALMNSVWTWAWLESSCNVLGGGALKVEATDLRRLLLPDFDELAVAELGRLGKLLTNTSDVAILEEIDQLVCGAIAGTRGAGAQRSRLLALANAALKHRSGG